MSRDRAIIVSEAYMSSNYTEELLHIILEEPERLERFFQHEETS